MITVVTAMFGDHDDPPRVPVWQDIAADVRWLYYTDSPIEAEPPWETHRREPRFASANLSAKVYKCCPPTLGDAIWIDANMEITSTSFVRAALAARSADGIAAWAHPRRHSIYDEAEATVGAERQGDKYDGFDLAGQIASYRSEGYPRQAGLFACGTIAYDLESTAVRRFGSMWFDECVRWSPQDQLSFPVVAWRLDMTVGVFPLAQINRRPRTMPFPGYLENDWMRIHTHRAPEVATRG